MLKARSYSETDFGNGLQFLKVSPEVELVSIVQGGELFVMLIESNVLFTQYLIYAPPAVPLSIEMLLRERLLCGVPANPLT